MATIVSTSSDETLTGTAASDTFVFAEGHGNDIIEDFDPEDILDLSGLTSGFTDFDTLERFSFQDGNDVLLITGESGDDIASSITFRNQTVDNLLFLLREFDSVIFSTVTGQVITGTGGDDTLEGDLGDDTITGGAGDDFLADTSGIDTYVFADDHGNDIIEDFDPEDILDLSGLTSGFTDFDTLERFSFQDGNDVLLITGESGDDIASSITFRNQTVDNLLFLLREFDSVIFSTVTGQVITGTGGDDTLEGDLGDDTITGGAGDDFLADTSGIDTYVFADDHGNDIIEDFDPEDILDLSGLTSGFTDFDTLERFSFQDGNDVLLITGESGDDIASSITFRNQTVDNLLFLLREFDSVIFSTVTGQVITGTGGDDTLEGDLGDDTITGGAGDDFLADTSGIDTYVFADDHGNDIIEDFDPEDILDLSGLTSGFTDFDTLERFSFQDGNDVLLITGESGDDIASSITFRNQTVDNLLFLLREFDSVIFSTVTGQVITGTGGDDTLEGDLGDDTITGGAGDDFLADTSGIDTYVFADDHGNDIIEDFDPEDILDLSGLTSGLFTLADILAVSREENGNVIIETGPDSSITLQTLSLSSLEVSDFIFEGQSEVGVESNPGATNTPSPMSEPVAGTDADDTLDGGGGNDTVDGGDGNDSLSGGDGVDTVRGGAGNDRIDAGTGDDFVSGGTGDDTVAAGTGNDAVFAGAGDMGDDVFVGGEGRDTLGGGAGNDLLVGDGASSTSLSGLGVGDTGLDDRDTIFGGDGDDTLLGGGFNDTSGDGSYDDGEAVTTGTEANTLYAGTGADLVIGASGNDTIGGGLGDDTLNGGDGDDTFYGGRGDGTDTGFNDVINGGDGNDTIFSSGGRDLVNGGDGDDELFSGGAVDTVDGGAGNDTIYGGGDDDLFTGGSGADTFAFFDGNGNDTITDFDTAEDTIDLNGTETDFTDLASVEAAASNTTQGGVAGLLIDTGTGDSIFLEGLTTTDLASINIVF
ncbi:calcium-binding protein [Kordiimonas sp. SCSIO 12610]|uniref:calcium-binding protein n=1 Tax=Kordiimonas sp. SCSIO 12610 TaxID=2829597 RepID=UPI00210AA384|nr:calcium-binding protein [Kordiimonas sp. SCSIO 12610]UTW56216.1 calcium-binding protein [Kordiimonas sp. SCSIO 12610]